jgi:hypothetical protein
MALGEYISNPDLRWGSDPEVFVVDGDGEILPSWKFLPKKEEAKPYTRHERDFGVSAFTDGFQAECVGFGGRSCLQLIVYEIRIGLQNILNEARKHHLASEFTHENTPIVKKDHLENEPMENVMLGCSPSHNVYGLMGDFPGNPRKLKYRFAGGHIHISGFHHPDRIERYVKTLDKIVGIYFVAAAAGIDNPIRRKYYGQAGEYRKPKWGLEYRALSNAWLIHPAVAHLAFILSRGAINLVDADLDKLIPFGDELTIETINNCDVDFARKIVNANKDLLTAIFMNGIRYYPYRIYLPGRTVGTLPAQKKGLFTLVEKGILNFIPDVHNWGKNWCLNQPEWPEECDKGSHEWRLLCPKLFPETLSVSVPAIVAV